MDMDNIYILGIESSCDETAASIYKGRRELSHIIETQIPIHQKYGGVVPEVASRNHTMALPYVVSRAVQTASIGLDDINYVAVTSGAGLSGALLAGTSFAKSLAYTLGRPIVGINHIQAHIDASYIEYAELEPPFLALVLSGGHTSIVRVEGYNRYDEIDKTLDDACGEAFDKVARLLGMGYPGGVAIEKMAVGGKANIDFFKAETRGRTRDFISFSGLKTAVINYLHKRGQQGDTIDDSARRDICASFMRDVIDIIRYPLVKAVQTFGYKTVVLAGGVAANNNIRNELSNALLPLGTRLIYPSIKYCTDNASMICMRAYNKIRYGNIASNFDFALNANSGLAICDNVQG